MLKWTPSTARRMRLGSRASRRCSAGRETSKYRARSDASTTGTDSLASDMEGLAGGVEAAGGAGGARVQQVGPLGDAAVEDLGAARVERAARRDGVEAGHGGLGLGPAAPPGGGGGGRGSKTFCGG